MWACVGGVGVGVCVGGCGCVCVWSCGRDRRCDVRGE